VLWLLNTGKVCNSKIIKACASITYQGGWVGGKKEAPQTLGRAQYVINCNLCKATRRDAARKSNAHSARGSSPKYTKFSNGTYTQKKLSELLNVLT
jgi:hypothetical protein